MTSTIIMSHERWLNGHFVTPTHDDTGIYVCTKKMWMYFSNRVVTKMNSARQRGNFGKRLQIHSVPGIHDMVVLYVHMDTWFCDWGMKSERYLKSQSFSWGEEGRGCRKLQGNPHPSSTRKSCNTYQTLNY